MQRLGKNAPLDAVMQTVNEMLADVAQTTQVTCVHVFDSACTDESLASDRSLFALPISYLSSIAKRIGDTVSPKRYACSSGLCRFGRAQPTDSRACVLTYSVFIALVFSASLLNASGNSRSTVRQLHDVDLFAPRDAQDVKVVCTTPRRSS